MKDKEIRIYTLLVIDTAFFFLEIIAGYAVHSLALVADSFHMLNDVFSLIVALWAVKVAKSRGVDRKFTYGWQRAEILGALVNGVFLVALCLSIFLEAIQRFVEPQVITNPQLILFVGTLGLLSNIAGLFLFHEHSHDHGHDHDHSHGDYDHDEESTTHGDSEYGETTPLIVPESYIESALTDDSTTEAHSTHNHARPKATAKKTKSLNMEGVFLHVLGDAMGNIGVIATALFIWKTNFSWKFYMDPAISLVITVIIFSSAMPLCRRAGSILLQGVPNSVNAEEAKQDILSLPGVVEVHDFHVWMLKEDMFIATLHVSVSLGEEQFMGLIPNIQHCLREHGVHSITVQPEFVSSGYGSADNSSACKLIGNKSSGGLNSMN